MNYDSFEFEKKKHKIYDESTRHERYIPWFVSKYILKGQKNTLSQPIFFRLNQITAAYFIDKIIKF